MIRFENFESGHEFTFAGGSGCPAEQVLAASEAFDLRTDGVAHHLAILVNEFVDLPETDARERFDALTDACEDGDLVELRILEAAAEICSHCENRPMEIRGVKAHEKDIVYKMKTADKTH